MQRKLTFLIILGIVLAATNFRGLAAGAQSNPTGGRVIDYKKDGIRFQVKASIHGDAASQNASRDDKMASLYVKLRISAHATEANYYGEITKHFPNVRLSRGSDEILFWQDLSCHQRRGLPKITVTAVDGSITTKDGKKIDVKARPRQVGKLLPSDEISAGRRLLGEGGSAGKYIAFRSRTNASHLAVDIKVAITDCDLGGAAVGAPR